MRRLGALIILLCLVGGGWYVFRQYKNGSSPFSVSQAKALAGEVDSQVAQVITDLRAGQLSFPSFPTDLSLPELDTKATVSATVDLSPEELWKTLREEGAQSVAGAVTQNMSVSVGNVSTQVLQEARYQYCVGVIQEYEKQKVVH